MKRIITLLILFSFVSSSIFTQNTNLNQGIIKQKKYLQKIPYENINGLLIVPVTINGKMYKFTIDTGSSLAISDKLFKELNPQVISQKEIIDSSDRKKEMKVIILPELHLEGVTFINTHGVVLHEKSYDFFNLFDCFGIDGIIGSNMLRNSVIQLDGESKHIIISNDFSQIQKKKSLQSQKMKLTTSQSNPYITVILHKEGKKAIGDHVLFDSGASDFYKMSMRTYDWLNGRINVTEKAKSEGSFAWGLHGTFEQQQHLLLNIPELHINDIIFDDITVTTTHTMSHIGVQLTKYGKITLDYKKKRFYFEPFDSINKEKLSERSWAILPTVMSIL